MTKKEYRTNIAENFYYLIYYKSTSFYRI